MCRSGFVQYALPFITTREVINPIARQLAVKKTVGNSAVGDRFLIPNVY